MTLEEISKTIEAEVITGRDSLKTEVEIGCASDLMSDVLAFAKPGAILLTGLANRQVIYTADVADIHAICFIRGKKPDEETIKLAEQKGQVLMTTRLPMFVSCGRLFKNGLTGLGYLDISKRNDRG
jgi:predicted transcriptional regulator